MSEGLLDTSVLIDFSVIDKNLPDEVAFSAVTLAELNVGVATAGDDALRAIRVANVQFIERTFTVIPFGPSAARAYATIVTAIRSAGRRERSRIADLLIAATAVAEGLDLYTRNPDDFRHLEHVLTVHPV
jgi:predicted nucleic acid-binding protein